MSGTYPLIPVISILSGALALIPLPRLLAHRNAGAVMYALWVSLGCFIHGINEIIWKDNTDNVAPVWCDISVRFYVGKSVAIPAASLAMTRRIYLMFSLRCPLASTRADKRRSILMDLGLSLGIPILQMIVYVFVQGQRYTIREEYGCESPVVNAWPSFLLVYTWPLMLALTSCVYCVRIVRIYLRRRRTIIGLDSPNNFGRYYRVVALGCADAVFTVPCSILLLVTNSLRGSIEPYRWSKLRLNLPSVYYYPSETWRADGRSAEFGFYWNVLASPICAIIFFCFFGLTWEVWEDYSRIFVGILRKLGFNPRTESDRVEPAVNLSNFRAAANQRPRHSENATSIINSIALTESTAGVRGQQDASGTLQDTTLNGTDYKLPPLRKDAMQPLDIPLTALEQA